MAHVDHAAPATRPALEVAGILRECDVAFAESHRPSARQRRVIDDLTRCRTAGLGGFSPHYEHCGAVTIQHALCRNPHCPKCQSLARTLWVEGQCTDLLDIVSVACGFDADEAGDAVARHLMAAHKGIQRVRPHGAGDWNNILQRHGIHGLIGGTPTDPCRP